MLFTFFWWQLDHKIVNNLFDLGKWDCFVSGGLAVGYGILETCIKEAAEEASVQGDLATKLVPAGCVR